MPVSRDIFAQMGVGTGQDYSLDSGFIHFLAESGYALDDGILHKYSV